MGGLVGVLGASAVPADGAARNHFWSRGLDGPEMAEMGPTRREMILGVGGLGAQPAIKTRSQPSAIKQASTRAQNRGDFGGEYGNSV
jgi:hypothetical protein